MENKTTTIKEAVRRVGMMYVLLRFCRSSVQPDRLFSFLFHSLPPLNSYFLSPLTFSLPLQTPQLLKPPQSRVFIPPDGLEYKWKKVIILVSLTHSTELFEKDLKHPVATTARLTRRDGNVDVSKSLNALLFSC